MVQAVTLLTLDAGSVLYLPDHMPDEIVLKHTDGELIRISRTNAGEWKYQRRDELGLHFYGEEKYGSSQSAMAAQADSQAFGFRVNGDPVNPLAIPDSSSRPATVELEGLVLGGVVIQDERHLPFAVFTTEECTIGCSSRKKREILPLRLMPFWRGTRGQVMIGWGLID